jgi:hypothetical protein
MCSLAGFANSTSGFEKLMVSSLYRLSNVQTGTLLYFSLVALLVSVVP